MELNRRQFLLGASGLGAAAVFGVAGPAFGAAPVDPRTATRNRLVVIFLEGGNDGLNYVIPRGDVPGAPRLSVYRRVRPTIAYKPDESLALTRGGDAGWQLGLNKKLKFMHSLYGDGRVAIVQGVDYPNHNYSHFASADIWHTGDPAKTGQAGWLGRHIDRVGVGEGELRAVAIAPRIPLMLQGRTASIAMQSIGEMRFGDGTGTIADVRHAAAAAMGAGRGNDPLRQRAGATLRQAVDLVGELGRIEPPAAQPTTLANSLMTARTLLEQNLGVECVYVTQGGYDTHTAQVNQHEQLLTVLDDALELFWTGMKPEVASRTLVMIASEFGRRIGEAAGGIGIAGTDHGAAAPVVLIGPPTAQRPSGAAGLIGGLHGDHPNMGTTQNTADNLMMTTDVRTLYQAVLQSWLESPDPIYADATKGSLRGLFTAPTGSAAAGGSSGRGGAGAAGALGNGTSTSLGEFGANGEGRDRQLGSRSASRGLLGSNGRAVHPVSVGAALAFNAFVAAIVLRSGRFRDALDGWRGSDALS